MPPAPRCTYIDIAKAIAITLVVYGHVASDDVASARFVLSFHMPLFFMLSGVFLKGQQVQSWADFRHAISRRSYSILIPFFLWACLYTRTNLENLGNIIYGSWESLQTAKTSSALWFFTALFSAYIIVHLFFLGISQIKYRIHLLIVGFAAIVFIWIAMQIPHPDKGYPWELDVAIMAAGFMLIGYISRSFLNNIAFCKMWQLTSILAISFILFLLVGRYTVLNNIPVHMCEAKYGNPILFVFNSLLGSFAIIVLSMWMDRILPSLLSKPLYVLGQITLPIFVLHKFWREQAWILFHQQHWNYTGTINSIIIVVTIILLSTLSYYLLALVCPTLFGKKDK